MKPHLEDDEPRRMEAAADWLLRLRDNVASDEDILSWMRWCEADPRNQQAFDRMEELWAVSGALEDEVRSGRFLAELDAEPIARPGDSPFAMRILLERARAWAKPIAVGAACAAALAVSFLLGRGGSVVPTNEPPRAELVREAQLSDRSTVQLATRSTVSILYTSDERALELKDGEAYFLVRPDERPFVVTAGPVRVRAVGTAFNVRRAAERVVVTVTEGKVDVYRSDDRPADALVVAAGSQIRWDEDEEGPVLASVNPSDALSWREGRLEYSSEPLRAVIHDLNRYADRPVVIRDEALGDLLFTGTLLTDSTAEWLATLPATLPVKVETQGGTDVIVAARSGDGAA